MAYLTELIEHSSSPVNQQEFLGLNYALRVAPGELADMTNMTGDHFPLLSVREPRRVVGMLQNPQGLLAKQQLAWAAEDPIDQEMKLWYAGAPVMKLKKGGPKQLVSMGAYICIWPDKMYFNTIDHTDRGQMDHHTAIEAGTMSATMCRLDGTDYDMTAIHVGGKAPEGDVGALWMDTSSTPHTLKQKSGTDEWIQVATTYIKLQADFPEAWAQGIHEYDVVDVTGLVNAYTGESEAIREQLQTLETSCIVYGTGDNYIIVAGILDAAVQLSVEDSPIKFDRNVPDMDFITENNNRLWGCKYGLVNGQVLNEIYACKLGDFRNWNTYMGLTTDSYTVSVGTDGPFTGAATLRGYPIFFKEDCIHRIAGDRPSTFQMNTTMCRGVEKGSERSLQIVDETLLYKSRTAVMRYDGSSTMEVSAALAGKVFHEAAAGAHAGKYYISMRDDENNWHLYVYDTKRGLWHREDDTHAICLADLDDVLYLERDDGMLITLTGGTEGTEEGLIEWSATFGVDGYEYAEQKYLKRYNLRMQLPKGSRATLYIQYNSDGKWQRQGTIKGQGLSTFLLPVAPHRCDHLQMKLTGCGPMKLYGLGRILEIGGDGSVNRR